MDIRNIKTFIRVAELKSFTKAAKELTYVQSTVTMQIQQLERELGFPLFDRVGKTVSLTVLGEEFLVQAYEILRIMEKVSSLDQDQRQLHGTLRVGVLESLLFGTMLQVLPQMRQQFPNLELQLKIGQTMELLQQLRQNQVDMVYLSSDLVADREFRCCDRNEEQLIFLSPPDHPLAKKQKISAKELLNYNFVVTEHTGICYRKLQELAAGCGTALRTCVEVDSVYVIAKLLQTGMVLAFLPEYAVRSQVEEGALVRLDVDLPPQIYYSQLLCHKSRWISPFMAGMIEIIKKNHTI